LKKVVEQFTNQLLEQQRTKANRCKALRTHGKKRGMRNGYKERHLTTEVKALTLRVPKIRDGIFTIDYLSATKEAKKHWLPPWWRWSLAFRPERSPG